MRKHGIIAIATALACMGLGARTITLDEAKVAAGAWARTGTAMGLRLPQYADTATSYTVTNGHVFYEVKMAGGSTVLMTGDTEFEPVIGFSSGNLNLAPGTPLRRLIEGDIILRSSMRRAPMTTTSTLQGSAATTTEAESLWSVLLGKRRTTTSVPGQTTAAVDPTTSVDDVRVAPLLETKWSQTTHNDSSSGKRCYNYYTPNHDPSGCTATGISQMMRYYKYPTDDITVEPKKFTCTVDGSSKQLETKGSPYDWEHMTAVPKNGVSDTSAEAIGRLLYDVGVALGSGYTSAGTGALVYDGPNVLKYFGYEQAFCFYNSDAWSAGEWPLHEQSTIETIIYANLDAKRPVVLGIYGFERGHSLDMDYWGGHCVVGDGYGYKTIEEVETPFVHINLGWSGADDMWYNLPTIHTGTGIVPGGPAYDYDYMGMAIFNVVPSGDGVEKEILSGQVVDTNGFASVNAIVTVMTNGFAVAQTNTDEHGIYAFALPGGITYELMADAADGSGTDEPLLVTLGTTKGNSKGIVASVDNVGNSWGNYLEVNIPASEAPENLQATLSEDGRKVELTWEYAPTGATFSVYRSTTDVMPSNCLTEVFSEVAGEFLYEDAEVLGWTNYYYWVTALRFDGTYRVSKATGPVAITPIPKYTVTFSEGAHGKRTGGGELTQIVDEFSAAIAPEIEADPGYTFYGWDQDFSKVVEDMTITAQYELITNKITYVDVKGAENPNPTQYTVEDDTITFAALSDVLGYIFVGWDPVEIEHGSVGDKTVTAQWKLNLPQTLDNTELEFTMGGEGTWYSTTETWHQGGCSLGSDSLAAGESATLATKVTGPGIITFWYRLKTNGDDDRLEVDINNDGVVDWTKSEETTDWCEQQLKVAGEGEHEIVWSHLNGSAAESGVVLVDTISWEPLPKTRDFRYAVIDNNAVVIRYLGADLDIYLPPTLDYHPVVEISSNAFTECTEITSVYIPAGVTNIGAHAFKPCPQLARFIVDADNEYYASGDCALYKFTDNDTATLVCCPSAFAGEFAMPVNVDTIGSEAFAGCAALTSVEIPSSIISIEANAFDGCTSLTKVLVAAGEKEEKRVRGMLENSGLDCTNITFEQLPTPDTYEVRYDPGAYGTGDAKSVDKVKDVTLTLEKGLYTRSGYNQTGWTTVDGSMSVDWELGDAYEENVGVTLYPVWQPKSVVKVSTALDNTALTFTLGGDSKWFGQKVVYHNNKSALQSGPLDGDMQNWFETTVEDSGTLSFWWKVDSEANFDILELLVDGESVAEISGEDQLWQQVTWAISGEGEHTIRWQYSKDETCSVGMDAGFVDKVVWKAGSVKTPVAVFDGESTLTFYYDDAMHEGTSYSVAAACVQDPAADMPWFADCHSVVTKVVFDESFKAYQPAHCGSWFWDFNQLTTIEGIANLDVSEATSLSYMFGYCSSLTTLDLTGFDTANATGMIRMFKECSALKWIYASDKFVTNAVEESDDMFMNCTLLKGGKGTSYSGFHIDCEYARLDGVDGKPGYFTLKSEAALAAVLPEPIPTLGAAPTADDIRAALAGSADKRLAENIVDADTYDAYRNWANSVELPSSKPAKTLASLNGNSMVTRTSAAAGTGIKVGQQAIKDSPNAWLAFAINSPTYISELPESGAVKIESFAKSATEGVYEFTASVEGLTIGSAAADQYLKTIFGLEGGASPDSASMSSEGISLKFDTPVDGKLRFTATLKNPDQQSFFMQLKLVP